MSRTGRCLSSVLVMALAVPAPLFASDHVVQAKEVAARLEAARIERATHLEKVERLLSEPVAAEAAAIRGLDVWRLRAGAATLSNEELRDLAARADSLESDPVAGGKKTWIVVGVVVVLSVLLAAAIVDSCKKAGAECLNK